MARAIAVVALAVAIIASVFAIWPVVADAPWEDDTIIEIERDEPATTDPRCETAIAIKAEATIALALEREISLDAVAARSALRRVIGEAEREIDLYC